jgi:uncharacterized SAM-binding protein YcdF (DUF218 family)
MDFSFITSLISAPSINLLLILLSLFLFKKHRKLGLSAFFLSVASLLVLSLPIVAVSLLSSIEYKQPLDLAAYKKLSANTGNITALVVLAEHRHSQAPEYGRIDSVDNPTLQRLHYASWLQQHNPLPILLSGGNSPQNSTAKSVLMNQTLIANFNIAPKWIESESNNLAQSAEYTSQLLKQAEVHQLVLITHALAMPKAQLAFEAYDLRVIPAPVGFAQSLTELTSLTDYLPHSRALYWSNMALQEKLSQVSYKFRF